MNLKQEILNLLPHLHNSENFDIFKDCAIYTLCIKLENKEAQDLHLFLNFKNCGSLYKLYKDFKH